MPNTNTPTDDLIELAEALAEMKERLTPIEAEHQAQTLAMQAALKSLEAIATGLGAVHLHHMQERITDLEARLAAIEGK